MAKGTMFRLDTADLAVSAGWHVHSTADVEQYSKDGAIIEVLHSSDDDVLGLLKRGSDNRQEVIDSEAVGKGLNPVCWTRSIPGMLLGEAR